MRRTSLLLGIFLLAGLAGLAGLANPVQTPFVAPDYDILIRNGLVYDGGAGEPVRADVAVKGDLIVRIGRSLPGTAARVIDARGLAVTPGFIDLHSHWTREKLDDGVIFPEGRSSLNFLLQGVTTIVAGQCGSSGWPMFEKAKDMMDLWRAEGIGPNLTLLVGHASVRDIVMGKENRTPTPEELGRMKALVKEAMDQGASGLSSGLYYVPGIYAKTDEVIELAKVIAPYGGIYHTHIRSESEGLLASIKEALEIGAKAGVPVHISHIKASGRANWGGSAAACALIEEAQKNGQKVSADQYPYRFSGITPYGSPVPRSAWLGRGADDRLRTEDLERVFDNLRDAELISLYEKVTPFTPLSAGHRAFLNSLPRKRLLTLVTQSVVTTRDFEGIDNARARSQFLKRLANPEEGRKIRTEIRANIDKVGAENYIVGVCVERGLEGKTLKEAAALKGKPVEDAAIELELEGAEFVPLGIAEADIEYYMKKDWVGTGSDGTTPYFGVGLTHVRSYSTFLDKIKKYALDRKVISVSHAIRSQTSLPAQIMNWPDRGWVKEGFKADIVVLDLAHIRTPASLSNPHQYAEGVRYLLINGAPVVEEGRYNGNLPGKILKLKKNK